MGYGMMDYDVNLDDKDALREGIHALTSEHTSHYVIYVENEDGEEIFLNCGSQKVKEVRGLINRFLKEVR